MYIRIIQIPTQYVTVFPLRIAMVFMDLARIIASGEVKLRSISEVQHCVAEAQIFQGIFLVGKHGEFWVKNSADVYHIICVFTI